MKIGHVASACGFLALAIAGAVACSSTSNGGGGQSCASYAPCGGNIVGSWTIDGACSSTVGDAGTPLPGCPGATGGGIAVTATGNATFTSDGHVTTSITTSSTSDITVPGSCLGAIPSCDALAAVFSQGGSQATCTGTAATSCACHIAAGPTTSTSAGTYTTSGSTLTVTAAVDGGTAIPATSTYCVQGSSLASQQTSGTLTLTFLAHD